MGYNTDFSGELELDPPLDAKQVRQINEFCEARHGGNMDPFPGFPGFWCNWETDGEALFWNGNEKSYDMFEWLVYLTEHFFEPWGVKLKGEVNAVGESSGDIWKIKADETGLRKVKARIVFEDDDGA
jgi:hypothetical protein